METYEVNQSAVNLYLRVDTAVRDTLTTQALSKLDGVL